MAKRKNPVEAAIADHLREQAGAMRTRRLLGGVGMILAGGLVYLVAVGLVYPALWFIFGVKLEVASAGLLLAVAFVLVLLEFGAHTAYLLYTGQGDLNFDELGERGFRIFDTLLFIGPRLWADGTRSIGRARTLADLDTAACAAVLRQMLDHPGRVPLADVHDAVPPGRKPRAIVDQLLGLDGVRLIETGVVPALSLSSAFRKKLEKLARRATDED